MTNAVVWIGRPTIDVREIDEFDRMRPQESEDLIKQWLSLVELGELNLDINSQGAPERICRPLEHIELG
ncbi:MAG: hypothetical protein ACKOGG_01570, partial [Actinomycetota bacterium]